MSSISRRCLTHRPFIMNTTDNEAVEKNVSGEYSLWDGKSYTISGTGSGTINGINTSTMTFADGTVFNGNIYLYDQCNFILDGNVTVNGNLSAYIYKNFYYLISSSGGSHTLTVNSITGEWMLDAGVKLCVKEEPSFTNGGFIHDFGGNNITQTTEEIGGVTYYVYDVPASTIVVGMSPYVVGEPYTVKFYNNSNQEVGSETTLSTVFQIGTSWFGGYVAHTAVAPDGATKYRVFSTYTTLTGDYYVDISRGPILIEDNLGSWYYKNL